MNDLKEIKSIRSELILSVLAILFLGLFLRIYHLNNESIWLDEAVSIKWANSSLFQILKDTSRDVHVPLYPIMLHFWVDLLGNSEFSIRFPSVIFGFFAIFMIYMVGNLIFDKEVGILSALLLALSTFHIYYSQEARMYSLMSLLTLLSIYFFIKLLEKKDLIISICYIISTYPLNVHPYLWFIYSNSPKYLYLHLTSIHAEGLQTQFQKLDFTATCTNCSVCTVDHNLNKTNNASTEWLLDTGVNNQNTN